MVSEGLEAEVDETVLAAVVVDDDVGAFVGACVLDGPSRGASTLLPHLVKHIFSLLKLFLFPSQPL